MYQHSINHHTKAEGQLKSDGPYNNRHLLSQSTAIDSSKDLGPASRQRGQLHQFVERREHFQGACKKSYIGYLHTPQHELILCQILHVRTSSVIYHKCVDCGQNCYKERRSVENIRIERAVRNKGWIIRIQMQRREVSYRHCTNKMHTELCHNGYQR